MAVAVANLPHASQMSPLHAQEAQDALLDALLSSCEKPARNPPLASFGRELKPYFAAPECSSVSAVKATIMHKKSPRNKSSVPPVASAAFAAAASTKQATSVANVNNIKAGAGAKKGSSGRAKTSPPKKRETSPANTSATPLLKLDSGEMAAFLSWAGPGFYVAPSPDKLPLPSTSLLV